MADRIGDRPRREHPGLDGREYAFAAHRMGKAGGIANQHDALVDRLAIRTRVDPIRVSRPPHRHIVWHLVVGDEKFQKLRDAPGKFAAPEPPEADVEIVVLANTPAVAASIPTEIQGWCFGRNGATPGLICTHLKLALLRDDDRAVVTCRIQ